MEVLNKISITLSSSPILGRLWPAVFDFSFCIVINFDVTVRFRVATIICEKGDIIPSFGDAY